MFSCRVAGVGIPNSETAQSSSLEGPAKLLCDIIAVAISKYSSATAGIGVPLELDGIGAWNHDVIGTGQAMLLS